MRLPAGAGGRRGPYGLSRLVVVARNLHRLLALGKGCPGSFLFEAVRGVVHRHLLLGKSTARGALVLVPSYLSERH